MITFSDATKSPRWLNLFAEAGMIAAAGFSAFLLRFEFQVPAFYLSHLNVALVVWIVIKLSVFHWFRMDRRAWRFFSVQDVLQLVRANATASIISSVVLLFATTGFPRSIYILDFILCCLFVGARYLSGRILVEARHSKPGAGRDILIYGAGGAGVALLSELRRNPALGLNVVGFIDDNPHLTEVYVQGAKVLGQGHELSAVATRTGAREVLIAAPSASPDEMFQILQHCQHAQVRFRTVAALGEIIEGKAMTAQIREVDVQDLLSRPQIELDHGLLHEKIEGRVVMVTGAAGSIGWELCRQLARFGPSRLVAFEIAETPLFHLEREMRQKFPELDFRAEIGSIQDPSRVSAVMAAHRPSIVYHAAAYKHVSMMESSVIEAVLNNVFGTYHVALAADEYGTDEFVLISSDKAVRPTSLMGATKRMCELLIRSLPSSRTRYVAVRFGNVLGSNGSVIPLFKNQIANGGPVTVTHPEMRRYFMTIPEASQLVLQASAMGSGAQTFVLDMGSQVKIVDIARKLIVLSGFVPEDDIKIEFTGPQPGEKLYEELNLDDEATVATSHRKIKIFMESAASSRIADQMDKLHHLCDTRMVGEVIAMIMELVPEYTPSDRILSQLPSAPVRKAVQQVPLLSRAAAAGVAP